MTLVRTPRERSEVRLAELTTLALGGPARRVVDATTDEHVIEAVARADACGEPVLVLGGGSNLVVADAGFDGTVLRVLTRGMSTSPVPGGVCLVAAAGEPWDGLVRGAVSDGLAGVECLAGIPGSVGATPLQNVGAYGQQVSDSLVSVRVYDRRARRVRHLTRAACGLAYRCSRLRQSERFVVLGVTLRLERSRLARPVAYSELARTLRASCGARPPLAAVYEAVLTLRRRTGMVLDPRDPDTVSAGSFFVNPVLSAPAFAALERRVAARDGPGVRPPTWPEPHGGAKTSAAWLIEHAGFHRGWGEGRVGISTKHALALVNRGGASTVELIALAGLIRDEVRRTYSVTLRPEPTLLGVQL